MEENRLKIVREELGGISQAKLSEELGFTAHKIRDIESGKIKKMPLDVAMALEEKFGFSSRWLLTGRGPRFKRVVKGASQVASGNGHVQIVGRVGGNIITGSMSGQVIGGDNHGRAAVNDSAKPQRPEEGHPMSGDIAEICQLLEDYGTPKLLKEIKERLLKVKKAVEGE